jgi:2-hydroxy-6-oxonona-2,4-dienedioate hydrolase
MLLDHRSGRRSAALRMLAASRSFDVEETTVGRLVARARVGGSPQAAQTLVLVPGLGLSGRYMLPLAAELAVHARVWVPVMPGFGSSDRPSEPLDLPAMGEFIVEWMAEVGIECAALVGNSMGCQIAVEAALRRPDRISHLVLDGPTIDSHARTMPQLIWRVALDALREPASLGFVQTAEWLATGPRRLARTARCALDHVVESRIGAVRCPVLVVRSGRDPLVSQRWAEELCSSAPRGSLHTVPRGTHALPYSDPQLLAAVVTGFLTSDHTAWVPCRR